MKWTKSKVKKEAKKYKTRSSFKNGSPSAYVTARRYKILDEACAHMKRPKIKQKNYWTEDRIILEAKKYKTRIEFLENCSAAYSAAGKLKIRDRACAHMVQNIWTKEKIIKEVKKYKSYTAFQNKSASAYHAARKLKILNDIKRVLPTVKNPCGFWTKNKLIKEARKYKNKTEFRDKSSAAYCAARKHMAKEEIFSHMPQRKSVDAQVWNRDKLIDTAKKFKNKTDFSKTYPGAAKRAKTLGIYDEITKHMDYKVRPNGTWTPEMVYKISMKYKTRGQFQSHERQAYQAARRLNIMDEACRHMVRVGNRFKRALYAFEFPDKSVYVGLTYNYDQRYSSHMKRTKRIIDKTNKLGHEFIMFNEYYEKEIAAEKEAELIEKYRKKGWEILNRSKAGALGSNITKWTKEEILKEAKQYNSIAEFNKANGSAYNAALKLGLKKEIKKHMTNLTRPARYWTKDKVLKEAKKYNTRSEFHKNSSSAFLYAKKLGIREECYKHMETPSRIRKWTPEAVAKEARKYKSRSEFQRNSRGAYKAAKDLGIKNEVCRHMKFKVRPNGTWTEDKIKIEAKKYKKKSHFKKGNGSAYQAAKRLGVLDKVCSHMPKDGRKNK